MTTTPGWYPDPATTGSLRWWDGQQWTNHTAPDEGVAQDPAAVASARKKRTRKTLLIVGACVIVPVLLITIAVTAIRASFAGAQADLLTEVVSSSEAGYAYTEPMLDLDPESRITFPVDFDWDSALAEAGGMENWAFELYLDPTLTRFGRAWVYQSSPGAPLEIHPFESNRVHGAAGDSAAVMPEQVGTSAWGLQPEYYLVRKIDAQGNQLDTPVVTKVSAEKRFEAPVVSASVNPADGIVELSWDAVPGANNYVVVGSAGIRTETDEYRYYSLLGSTDTTTWSSKDQIERLSPADFYPSAQNLGLELFDDESADELLGDNVWSLGNDGWVYEQSGFSWGVVATDGKSYSPIAEVDATGLAGSLPLRTAWNTMVQWGMSHLMSDTFNGLASIPREFAFTSLDGVTRTTQARIPEDGISVEGDEWVIRVEGVGTQLGEEIEFTFYDGAPTTPETFTAQFNAEAASLRPNTGLGNYTVISATPEEISDAIDAAATKPAQTPYPSYGSDDYVRFLASHLIAGTEYIDVTDFAVTPGAQSFRDAFDEALYQNPFAVGVPNTSAITFNPVKSGDRVVYHLYYELGQSEREAMQSSMAETIESVLAQTVDDSMSAAEKAIALNNWVTARSQYDHDALATVLDGRDITPYLSRWRADGVFGDGLVVCLGYAAAYSALMNAAGVPTVVVTGDVLSGGGHAWNKVSVDGTWLSVDPTWNDSDSAPNSYLLIPDSAFTGDAQRVEDLDWIRDDRVPLYATP